MDVMHPNDSIMHTMSPYHGRLTPPYSKWKPQQHSTCNEYRITVFRSSRHPFRKLPLPPPGTTVYVFRHFPKALCVVSFRLSRFLFSDGFQYHACFIVFVDGILTTCPKYLHIVFNNIDLIVSEIALL